MGQTQRNKPFHSKYRPINLINIVGQDHIVSYFKKALKKERITSAYLFIGKHGVGKTTTSRLVAKVLNCSNASRDKKYEPCNNCTSCINISAGCSFDVYEINAAMNTGVDNMREMIEKIQLSPVNNLYKICIIDAVHMLSASAFNAILKVLEEPPKNVVFILATTDIKRIPSTIISRCHKLRFLPLSETQLSIAITKVIWLEKGNITNKALKHVLNSSKGSFRDALNMVDMLMTESKNIDQKTCSFISTEVPNSISTLLLKSLLLKNINKILHILRYLEYKTWTESSLIDQIQSALTQCIINNQQLYSHNDYCVNLWQLLVQYKSLPAGNSVIGNLIPDIIFIVQNHHVQPNVRLRNNKKLVPKIIKMKVRHDY
jgi:DNA polymerase-3 subunit gamma/tau